MSEQEKEKSIRLINTFIGRIPETDKKILEKAKNDAWVQLSMAGPVADGSLRILTRQLYQLYLEEGVPKPQFIDEVLPSDEEVQALLAAETCARCSEVLDQEAGE
jgi:hypothetical protein